MSETSPQMATADEQAERHGLLDQLRSDLRWWNRRDGWPTKAACGWLRVLTVALLHASFRIVFLYRLARSARQAGRAWLAVVLTRIEQWTCGLSISPTAEIGHGVWIPHPVGIVIGASVRVGSCCVIGQNVTLGGNFGKQDAEGRKFPTIGDRCFICAGAVVGGPVTIGHDSIVGANSVVTRDLPPYAMASGIPAKVIRELSPECTWIDRTLHRRPGQNAATDAGASQQHIEEEGRSGG